MTEAEPEAAGARGAAGGPAGTARLGGSAGAARSGALLAGAERATPTEDGDVTRNPWERFSWILGIVWVVFMLFPLSAALRADVAPLARAGGFALLLAYSAVYIATYIWMIRSDDWMLAWRRGLTGIAVMIALMASAALLVGPDALGAGAFLLSIAAFAGPVRRAMLLMGSLFVGLYAVIAIVLTQIPNGFAKEGILFMPPAIVLVSVSAVRLLISAGDRHDQMVRQRDLVAERERVARDVHDVLGHSLTIVTVKAELAERLVDIDPARAKAELAQIRSLSREALAEVRATVSGLRVARLGDELGAAAEGLRAAGVSAEVPSDPDEVDPRYRIIVAWVLREAVTNVVRHANAARCRIVLFPDGVAVDDDGVGIRPEASERGLRGIRERVVAAGASLEVGPSREFARGGAARLRTGTRIEVRW